MPATRGTRKISGKTTVKNTENNASDCNYGNKLQLSEHEIASLSSTITERIAGCDHINRISSFMNDLDALITSMNNEILTLMNAGSYETKQLLLS